MYVHWKSQSIKQRKIQCCLFNKHPSNICHLQKSIRLNSHIIKFLKELKAVFHGNEPSSSLSAATAVSFSRLFPVPAVQSSVSDTDCLESGSSSTRVLSPSVTVFCRVLVLRSASWSPSESCLEEKRTTFQFVNQIFLGF